MPDTSRATHDFNDTNQTLDGKAMDTGGTWGIGRGAGCDITSNQATAPSAPASQEVDGLGTYTDCMSEAKSANRTSAGPAVRDTGASAMSGYAGVVSDTTNDTVQIRRYDNGTWAATIGTSGNGVFTTAGQKLSARAVGTTISVRVDGVEEASGSDSTYASGVGAIYFHAYSNRWLDDYELFEITAAAGILPQIMHHRRIMGVS